MPEPRSQPTVHIVDETPAFRRGLAVVFHDAGIRTTEAAELAAGEHLVQADAALIGTTPGSPPVSSETAGGTPYVVIVDRRDIEEAIAWLRGGATGIVERNAPTDAVVAAVTAALSGHSVVPTWVMAAALRRMPTLAPTESWVTEDEIAWLQALSKGVTVAALAKQIAYSERETFRLLHSLYSRIGVANRTEALMWATRHGLI